MSASEHANACVFKEVLASVHANGCVRIIINSMGANMRVPPWMRTIRKWASVHPRVIYMDACIRSDMAVYRHVDVCLRV